MFASILALVSALLLAVSALTAAPDAVAAETRGALTTGAQAPAFRLPVLSANAPSTANIVPGAAAGGDATERPTSPDRPAQRSLSEFHGQVVWLDFWASWCAPCRLSFPWMNAMQEKFGARGFQVVAINVDRRLPDARRFLAEVPANFVVLHDADATTPPLYGVAGMPTSVLIGRDGRVLMTHVGFARPSGARLEAAIGKALDAR